MNILAIDDERLALEELTAILLQAQPEASVVCFRSPTEALDYARSHAADVAFVDIRMRDMDGLTLAKELSAVCPLINIIFLTGYSDHALDAFQLHASGYLLKPVTLSAVQEALTHLRFPVELAQAPLLSVQTFGNFEVFSHGRPLVFRRSKAKEVLAYLIHRRGASCTLRELSAALFEDRFDSPSLQNQMQTYISSMRATLREAGAEDVLMKQYNSLAVNTALVSCDYYRLLAGDAAAMKAYTGEYMANYSWAEGINAYLDSLSRQATQGAAP